MPEEQVKAGKISIPVESYQVSEAEIGIHAQDK